MAGLQFSHVQAHSSEWNISEVAVRYFSQVRQMIRNWGTEKLSFSEKNLSRCGLKLFFRFLKETLRNCTNFIKLTLSYFNIRPTCIWNFLNKISKTFNIFSCQFHFKPWQIQNINIWHELANFYISLDSIYISNVSNYHQHQTPLPGW